MADPPEVTGCPGVLERAWTVRVIRNRVLSFATDTDLTTMCRVNRDHFHDVVPLLWRSRLIKRAVQELMSCAVDPARYLTYARAVREISVQELPAAGIAPLVQSLPGLQKIIVRSLGVTLELVGSIDANTRGVRCIHPGCFPRLISLLKQDATTVRSAIPRDWSFSIVIDYAVAADSTDLDAFDNLSLTYHVHFNRLWISAGAMADITALYEHLQLLPLHTIVTTIMVRTIGIVHDGERRPGAVDMDGAKAVLQAFPDIKFANCYLRQPLSHGAIRMLLQNLVLLRRFTCIHLSWDLSCSKTRDDLLAMPLPLWRDKPLSASTIARSPYDSPEANRSIKITVTATFDPDLETTAMRRGRLFSDTLWLEQLARLCLLLGGPLAAYHIDFDIACQSDSSASKEELAAHCELSHTIEVAYRTMLRRIIATMVHGYREARDPGWKRISDLKGQDEA